MTLPCVTRSFVAPTANPAGGILALSGIRSLTVGSIDASTIFPGNPTGSFSGGLAIAGTGIWSLTGPTPSPWPFNDHAGTVLIGSTCARAASAPITHAGVAEERSSSAGCIGAHTGTLRHYAGGRHPD